MKLFVRYKKLIMLFALLISICLIGLSGLTHLTSVTQSKLIHSTRDSFTVQLGNWWDKSELVITEQSYQMKDACPSVQIHFTVQNQGVSMLESTHYYLYFSENGSPIKNGNLIKEGTISPLASMEEKTLVFPNLQNGHYQLKVNQHPLYQNKKEQQFTKSPVIKAFCELEKGNVNKEQIESTPTKEQTTDHPTQTKTLTEEIKENTEQKIEKTTEENADEIINNEQEITEQEEEVVKDHKDEALNTEEENEDGEKSNEGIEQENKVQENTE
ncbi:amyloid fiber anchoring/assembly protein TapA [Gracilibacillus dipsosauri]|uniref:Amyloid fiber anchoring/assembly protein TapA n=1 Tax=Gracilibacillus dipsosauri TaxID=178340 RepID=A0A317L212_9BACI|nr:amyloid fiber anchoring/assembly protein TapA [Gracilibacillus dipsosauri]PWU69294.1 amyloid fiber anchoring/assembly protein TapA [Gracilibacillus dipsosauri]